MLKNVSRFITIIVMLTMIFPAHIFAAEEMSPEMREKKMGLLEALSEIPMCSSDLNGDGAITYGEGAACVGGVCPIGAEECVPVPDPICDENNPGCAPPINFTCMSNPDLPCTVMENSEPKCASDGTYLETTGQCHVDAETSCPPGYNQDGDTGVCYMDYSCPQGGTLDTVDNVCKFYGNSGDCPTGYIYDPETFVCKRDAACSLADAVINAELERCEIAVASHCPTGYLVDPESGLCIDDPVCPGGTYVPEFGKCVAPTSQACPEGMTPNGAGKCVADPACPEGSNFNTETNRCEGSSTLEYPSPNPYGACVVTGSYGPVGNTYTWPNVVKLPGEDTSVFGLGLYFNDQCFIEIPDTLKHESDPTRLDSEPFYTGAIRDTVSPGETITYKIPFFGNPDNIWTYNMKNDSANMSMCYGTYGTLTSGSDTTYATEPATFYGPPGQVSIVNGEKCSSWIPNASAGNHSIACMNFNSSCGVTNVYRRNCYRLSWVQNWSCTNTNLATVNSQPDEFKVLEIKTKNYFGNNPPYFLSYSAAQGSSLPEIPCPDGGDFNTETHMCVGENVIDEAPSCPSDSYMDPVTDKCTKTMDLTCPEGTSLDETGNMCVADPWCSTGGTLDLELYQCKITPIADCGTYPFDPQTNVCYMDFFCPLGGVYDATAKECRFAATQDCGEQYMWSEAEMACVHTPDCTTSQAEEFTEPMVYSEQLDKCVAGTAVTCPGGYTAAGGNTCEGEPWYESTFCSTNECKNMNFADLEPPETKQYESYTDDGQVDDEGNCMDEILIFNGKAGECFNPSLATAWFDCCEPIPEEKKPDGVENTENTIAAIEAITAVLEAIEAVTATIEAVTSALSVMGPLAIVGAVIALVAELLITGCPEEGFAVAQARGAEAAVYVGDYCVTEWIFGCYQSAKVFCTFESKLGRIIQEQGRPQIDRFLKREGPIGERGELILDEDGNTMVDWGTVSKPRCEGFRPIEFQALDFAKIDMSEYFDDVEEKAAEALDGAKQDFTDSIQNFYDGLDR